jgi:hypothetical protein
LTKVHFTRLFRLMALPTWEGLMGDHAKRVVFSVRWCGCVERPWCFMLGRNNYHSCWRTKGDAVGNAARYCRDMLLSEGTPSELMIYNKNGKLGKGSSSRRTFGNDSRKTKG